MFTRIRAWQHFQKTHTEPSSVKLRRFTVKYLFCWKSEWEHHSPRQLAPLCVWVLSSEELTHGCLLGFLWFVLPSCYLSCVRVQRSFQSREGRSWGILHMRFLGSHLPGAWRLLPRSVCWRLLSSLHVHLLDWIVVYFCLGTEVALSADQGVCKGCLVLSRLWNEPEFQVLSTTFSFGFTESAD